MSDLAIDRASAGGDAAGRRATRPLVAGNWKMHLVRYEADSLCRKIRAGLEALAKRAPRGPEVALFPSFPLIQTAVEALAASGVGVGGQDLHTEDKGAFTGDVSGRQLADSGATWALCGHSERRQGRGESDAQVAAKAAAAARAGLMPLVCVGETAAERASGATFAVLDRQVAPLSLHPGFTLAYEPVWAIGTGQTASPEIAQEAHAHLRRRLHERFGDGARPVRILYGGSVTPDNAAALAAMPDLDGALVGGASLDSARFLAIISAFAAR